MLTTALAAWNGTIFRKRREIGDFQANGRVRIDIAPTTKLTGMNPPPVTRELGKGRPTPRP